MNYRFTVGDDVQMDAFMNVRNIFNTDPAQVGYRNIPYIVYTANSALYDILGRRYTIGVNYEF